MSPEQATGEPLDHRRIFFRWARFCTNGHERANLTGEKKWRFCRDRRRAHLPSYEDNIPKPVENILMRALEKDRQKRYQSAWEMQYDIDTYLASCEFTPSNIHLANFLKQIFEDEIREEQEQLRRLRNEQSYQAASAYDEMLNEEIVDIDSLSGEMVEASSEGQPAVELGAFGADEALSRSPTPSGRFSKLDSELNIRLGEKELKALEKVAERHGMDAAGLARELVRQQLRWL